MAKRILVVDNEPDFLELVKSRLSTFGYEVWTAPDGKKGLELTRRKKPDLILIDYLMPGLDGSAVCKQIKSGDTLKKIPVIFFTASPHLLTHETIHSTQADDYLVKPFDPAELQAKIKHYLE